MGETEEWFWFCFSQEEMGYGNDLETGLWNVLAKPRTHASQHGLWKAA